MTDYTFKAVGLTIATAAVVALVGASQEPWWWCNTFGCSSDISDSTGSPPPGSLLEPKPEPGEPKFRIIPAVPAHMDDLLMGTNLQGLDINNGERVQNVQACVKQCAETDQCKAMTYVYTNPNDTLNGICWLKGSAPDERRDPYMISARKVPAVPEQQVPL